MVDKGMFEILTSRSAVGCCLTCPRRRWWEYEAENGTSVNGWSPLKLNIQMTTGIFVHKGVELVWRGMGVLEAAVEARKGYLVEIAKRGLDVEVLEQLKEVIDEQASLIEGMVVAWGRVRLPKMVEEYEVVGTEREELVGLGQGVGLMARTDALLRRRVDGRLFIYNPKTVATPDDRWLKSWEVDMQLMTEVLAVEDRLAREGTPATLGGVVVEGFIKGPRVKVDEFGKEIRDKEKEVKGYATRSRLLYGYKLPASPPFERTTYDHEYTSRKGWVKFKTWEEKFEGNDGRMSSVAWWVNWMPEEALEAMFMTIPPIMRDTKAIESQVRQIVGIEGRVRKGRDLVMTAPTEDIREAFLDEYFPQNTHSCFYPGRCSMLPMCFDAGVAGDPKGSGLYVPRTANHPVEEGE